MAIYAPHRLSPATVAHTVEPSVEITPAVPRFIPGKPTFFSQASGRAILLPGAGGELSTADSLLDAGRYLERQTGLQAIGTNHAFHRDGPSNDSFHNLRDYERWLHAIGSHFKSDRLPFGIIGRSSGANFGLQYAHWYPGEAEFVVAMSPYFRAWARYSLDGVRQRNIPAWDAINWIAGIDRQWEWHDSHKFGQHVMILIGDRDGHYPWRRSDVTGPFQRRPELPPDGIPYYIKEWQRFAKKTDCKLVIINGGGHNLFDGTNVSVFRAATEAVRDHLQGILPEAGAKYYVGIPFQHQQFREQISDRGTAATTDEAEGVVQSLEQQLAKYPANVRARRQLVSGYERLRRVLIQSQSQVAFEEVRALLAQEMSHYHPAVESAYPSTADFFVGKPIQDKNMQLFVQDTFFARRLYELLPKTKSVETLISVLSTYCGMSVDPESNIELNVRAYDFHNEEVHINVRIEGGTVSEISLRAERGVLERMRTYRRYNDLAMRAAYGTHLDKSAFLEDNGDAFVLRQASWGKTRLPMPQNEWMLCQLVQAFFPYYPHLAVADVLRFNQGDLSVITRVAKTNYDLLREYQATFGDEISLFYSSGKAGKRNIERQKELLYEQ